MALRICNTRPISLSWLFAFRDNRAGRPRAKEISTSRLIVWGKNDAYISTPGAEGYKGDLKDVDYKILPSGHFALEEDHVLTNLFEM